MLRYYYTFQELLDDVSIENVNMPRHPHDMEMSSAWFTSLIEDNEMEIAVYTLSELITDDIINDVVNALMGIVYNRHSEDFIAMIDHENNSHALKQALSKIINVIDLTIPRYIPLLQQNEKYSYNPLAPVSSQTSGKTRFNDTPQDEGDYNDDEHATNVSASESETVVDSGSIMERLTDLFKNFKPIMLDWSNEFNQLFFKEEQL